MKITISLNETTGINITTFHVSYEVCNVVMRGYFMLKQVPTTAQQTRKSILNIILVGISSNFSRSSVLQ